MTRSIRHLALLFPLLWVPLAEAQQQVGIDIYKNQAAASVKLAVPFPRLAAGITPQAMQDPFYAPLLRDLAFSDIFSLVSIQSNVAVTTEIARRAGAQGLLNLSASAEAGQYVLEARLFDVASNSMQMGRRYRGSPAALTRLAHTIANDLVQYFNGKPGLFLSQIAFISTREGGHKEIYLMDYDGSNVRRISFHETITLSPHWSPDDERIAYTSFARGTSDLYLVSRHGGGRIRLETGVSLNIAPSFSPDGKDIAFVGSVAGNPDIYLIGADGRNVRRLTSANTIESTPTWSPTGRQIAFTSSRSGSPQIFLMDAEGTNVRRVSFEGEWNDDPSFSPAGDLLAYTSRVNGKFQIRVLNLATQESSVLAGEGSNEQPSWSPDGKYIVFMSNRSGSWQIYRIAVDGTGLTPLTSQGENTAPNWSRRFE